MDIVTHALLGSAIAEAGFREKLGARALVAGAVLAVLPDADVVVRLQGPWEVLKYHRGPTHSLIVIALVSPLIGWLLWLWTRKHARPARGGPAPETQGHRISPWNWILLAFAAFVQNPLLDLCTSYGTQLLWPLTTRRFAIDAVAIIDPLYTLPLLAAFLIACIPGIRRLTRTFAACVLVLTTGYLAFGFLQMERARSLASAQLAWLCAPLPLPSPIISSGASPQATTAGTSAWDSSPPGSPAKSVSSPSIGSKVHSSKKHSEARTAASSTGSPTASSALTSSPNPAAPPSSSRTSAPAT
jgi:membrane-bound metal-dependent hydrolase YbcI (DUF457 family)